MRIYASAPEILYHQIYKNLIHKECNRIQAKIDDLVERNIILGGSYSMRYRGRILMSSQKVIGHIVKDAYPQHHVEFTELIEMQDKYKKDVTFVRQTLTSLIPDAADYQDMRDCLSDLIASKLDPEISKLSRVREEAFYIKNSEMKLKQWEKAKGILEQFIINLMVFA